MKHYPIVFSIGASDCLGSAGVQADNKVVTSLGAYACAATTSIVVHNTQGAIESIHNAPVEFIEKQIKAVMEDIHPDVIKIGFVNDTNIIRTIAEGLRKYHPRYVVFDPVIFTIAGQTVLEEDAIKAIQDELFHFTNLITLTLEEAEALTSIKVSSREEMAQSAQNLSEISNMSILLRGFCPESGHRCHILHSPNGEKWIYDLGNFVPPRIHGVGSCFSAAVAAYIALGKTLNEAVEEAQVYIQQAVKIGSGVRLGRSSDSICHSFEPEKMRILNNGF
ncbi:hydroxymethylpyrimidine/phosphomethylpyrimidine kinase [Bacteroides sp. 224]|uniref:bifunctional hydroxymethylpyrimidine kinase/phosphomethylpyrimidine kinase n=1 Tax=Bacteroides sp. 224 TaxID=2302936 RepID=UPI0013D6A2F5|nr:hydroxymethylpyrimidine/phosphomethylpyrimidine kinase [Bacteroides sp. 224]NDV64385.1 hydroxymethylpyrimidine/phosphomethylpyrimidine kinase [Bacteroides sp. 224]